MYNYLKVKSTISTIIILTGLFVDSTASAQESSDYKKNFLGLYGGISIASGAYTRSPDFFTTGRQFSIGYRRSPNRFFSYKLMLRHISAPRNQGKTERYYGFTSVSSYASKRLDRYEIHGGPVFSLPYKQWSVDFRIDGAIVYAIYPSLQITGSSDTLSALTLGSDTKFTFGYAANFWLRHNFKGNFSIGFGLDYSSVKVTFDEVEKQWVSNANITTTTRIKPSMYMNSMSVLLSIGMRF